MEHEEIQEEPQKEAKVQKDEGLFDLGFGEVGESTNNNLDFGIDF